MTTTPDNSCRNSSLSLSNYIIPTKITIKSLIKKIYKLFHNKYSKLPLSYDSNIIDNIIYNEKSHIVARFKDRLIIDDTGEFLKRYYKKNESDIRLPKFYEYYELYSKIFPNYTAFNEGKYLYQNIQRKQRMIDLQEKMEFEEKQNKEKNETRKRKVRKNKTRNGKIRKRKTRERKEKEGNFRKNKIREGKIRKRAKRKRAKRKRAKRKRKTDKKDNKVMRLTNDDKGSIDNLLFKKGKVISLSNDDDKNNSDSEITKKTTSEIKFRPTLFK